VLTTRIKPLAALRISIDSNMQFLFDLVELLL
jgi:hypothetical protein